MPIEFKNEAQKATYEQVAQWMTEIFGEQHSKHDSDPVFLTKHGSAGVTVVVEAWGEDDSEVAAFSWVVTGAEMTLELASYLLGANMKVRFGAFAVDDEGDILFRHTIVGSTIDKEELRASVLAVAASADEYDDLITQRFGGQRPLDR